MEISQAVLKSLIASGVTWSHPLHSSVHSCSLCGWLMGAVNSSCPLLLLLVVPLASKLLQQIELPVKKIVKVSSVH